MSKLGMTRDYVSNLMSNHGGEFGIVATHQHHHAFESPDV